MMQKITIYLLSFLIIIPAGGMFHHHDAFGILFYGDGNLSFTEHHCRDHVNHPDIPHTSSCLGCVRLLTPAASENDITTFGNLRILNALMLPALPDYTSEEFLKNLKPRSPPSAIRSA
jgi:hypothetical protein